jgi:hypothetical protein
MGPATLLTKCKAEGTLSSQGLRQLVDGNGTDLIRVRRRLLIEVLRDATPENVDVELTITSPYERGDIGVTARQIRISIERVLDVKPPENRPLKRERQVRELIESRQCPIELAELDSSLLKVLPVIGPRRIFSRFRERLLLFILLRDLLRLAVVERDVEYHSPRVVAPPSTIEPSKPLHQRGPGRDLGEKAVGVEIDACLEHLSGHDDAASGRHLAGHTIQRVRAIPRPKA